MSIPAQIMTEHNLDRVVYFVLRSGSNKQRDAMEDLLSRALLERIPLKRARREMWVCHTTGNGANDAAHLQDYDTILRYVFGSNCRVRVRIMWRAAV